MYALRHVTDALSLLHGRKGVVSCEVIIAKSMSFITKAAAVWEGASAENRWGAKRKVHGVKWDYIHEQKH